MLRVIGHEVLNAFREVQDDLTALTVFVRAGIATAVCGRGQADIGYISTNRYNGGLVSYLDAETAQQQNLLSNEQQLVSIQGQRLSTTSIPLVVGRAGRRMGCIEP